MQLLLCFSAVVAAALGVNQNFGSQPTNFQQSQNFHTDQFQTEQFQSQGFQQQEFKLQPSSHHGGQSNQYLPPSPNSHSHNNNNNNHRGNNNNNNNNNQLQQGYRNPGQGQGGFQQNQAQSINFQGSQYQGNQAQQAYGNKLQNHQNQHQNQQSNFQNQNGGLGGQKNQNRFQAQNKQQIYHTETHNAAAIRAHSAQSAHSAHSAHSASSSSKFAAQSFKSSAKKLSSQSSIHDDDIIRNEASPDGSYAYSYDTNDGTSVEQSGYIKNPTARSDDKILSVKGSYSYIAPEGDRISVSYVADENGYRATSSKS